MLLYVLLLPSFLTSVTWVAWAVIQHTHDTDSRGGKQARRIESKSDQVKRWLNKGGKEVFPAFSLFLLSLLFSLFSSLCLFDNSLFSLVFRLRPAIEALLGIITFSSSLCLPFWLVVRKRAATKCWRTNHTVFRISLPLYAQRRSVPHKAFLLSAGDANENAPKWKSKKRKEGKRKATTKRQSRRLGGTQAYRRSAPLPP